VQIHISTSDGLPIYVQIVNQVKYLVASGRLSAGEELPPIRVLADRLVVNPNTVARAYTELEREGLLVSRPGRGVYVAQPRIDLTRAARDRRLIEPLDRWLTEAVHLGYSADEVLRVVAQRVREFHWQSETAA